MTWITLSPCGTSLLTNAFSESEPPSLRSLIFRYANARDESDVPEDARESINARIARVRGEMISAPPAEVKTRSAELNAIVTLYAERGRQLGTPGDFHWLVCTDTWLGEATSSIVADWLRDQGFAVAVHRQTDLQTQSLAGFKIALSDLAAWCYENLPPPEIPGTTVLFNLTGGFKGVNGFLQTVGVFRADEVVYIFEGQKELMSIPRLPLRVASVDVIEKNLRAFRRMSLRLPADAPVSGIPDALLLDFDGSVCLSAWGEIQWNEARGEIYSSRLLDSPDDSIVLTETLRRDAEKHRDRFAQMNLQIDKLASYFAGSRQKHLESLGFERVLRSAEYFEFKAWDDGKGYRFFGRYEGSVFMIEKLAPGLH